MRVRRRRAIAAGLVVAAAGVAGGVIVSGGDDAVDDPVDALAVGEITTVLGDGGEIDETGDPGVETGIGRVSFVAVGSDGTLWASGFDAGPYTLVDGRAVDTPGVDDLAEAVGMAADGDAMLIIEQFPGGRIVRIAGGERLLVAGGDLDAVREAAGSDDAVGPRSVAALHEGEIAFTAAPGGVWRTVDGDVELVNGFSQSGRDSGIADLVAELASDADETLYLSDPGAGTVTGVTADGMARTVARDLEVPSGIAVGPDGTLYVALAGAHQVVAIDPDGGAPEVIAGRGTPGFSGDGGPAATAALDTPVGLATDGTLLWIADRGNERVRVVRLR